MKRIFDLNHRLVDWRLFVLLTGLVSALPAKATDALYQNFSSSYYYVGGNSPLPPPSIDATAFDNENIFSISYENFNITYPYYETANTFFYTNNGTMIANSPPQTNGFGSSFGNGYVFDLQTTNAHRFADTFYNAGTIRCNSTNDGNNLFNSIGLIFLNESIGKLEVDATNVINSGTLNAGPNGQIVLNSQNADISFGSLMLEAPLTIGSLFRGLFTTAQTTPNLTSVGANGIGNPWDPSQNLGANFATSSIPNRVALANSSAYVAISADATGTNIIVRSVFILNNSPNVPYKVYFGAPSNPVIGGGLSTVEWDGIYEDPATCNTTTNYLYLNDVSNGVTQTNLLIINGVPSNFTLTRSSTPLISDLTPAQTNFSQINLIGGFSAGGFTNPYYAYFNASLLSSAASTNASNVNPNGSVTNLAGKIFINASNKLNLANAQITGANYLSINSPNQFDGSPNSYIVSPYSDINVGVTNGNLNVQNLLSSAVPTISGTMQVWTGEWFYANPLGLNIDYRVEIINSQLQPVATPWIQNLKLHATNSLVINDAMSIYNSLYIDAQKLTLATNTCGNGFTSFDGELNWANTPTLGPTQLPNVLWLTNNGAIRAVNDAIFGTTALRYGAFINSGLVSDLGTTIWTTNFVNGGVITNGSGAFTLQSPQALMTNGALYAGGNISLTTSNLIITNELIIAGRSLTILATNLFTDILTNGLISSNYWSVGGLANTGDGLVMPIKPAMGDLLGTTITNIAPSNKSLINVWAGQDRGYSLSGYVNNEAVGHLVLDAQGVPNGRFTFNGASVSNAMYVDEIEFLDYSTNRDASGNMQGITFGTNMVIYFAQAIRNGVSFADKLNKQNTNNLYSHFRWMPTYAGYFSSTNIVYPDGTTNTFNAALKQSTTIDSDGDGIVNADDSTPFFIASQINFNLKITNAPPRYARLTWTTIPNATNTVMFKTNLLSPTWSVLTNFVSPQPYPSPASSVTILDPVGTNSTRFYRISVQPWLTYPN